MHRPRIASPPPPSGLSRYPAINNDEYQSTTQSGAKIRRTSGTKVAKMQCKQTSCQQLSSLSWLPILCIKYRVDRLPMTRNRPRKIYQETQSGNKLHRPSSITAPVQISMTIERWMEISNALPTPSTVSNVGKHERNNGN
ncbi:hypothetical protein CLAIMM_14404 isoform 2 [Cladophialophora immunda]|nr:hypothetical protein CLAIMM_14404 isoform 2 [Cladophialophora immunda]